MKKEDDVKFGVISIILTAIGLGILIGISNKPYTPPEEEYMIEESMGDEIDP